jgi:5-(aminomethyl)-3-furanmethanol phosphate kinase
LDAMIKLGGSLAQDPERLTALCCKLSELAKNYTITVVPGGGKFADIVREFDHRFNLPAAVSHRMAIMGMDQFGLFLSQIIPNSCATYELNDVKQLSEIGAVPIFLPSRLMVKENPLENSWRILPAGFVLES